MIKSTGEMAQRRLGQPPPREGAGGAGVLTRRADSRLSTSRGSVSHLLPGIRGRTELPKPFWEGGLSTSTGRALMGGTGGLTSFFRVLSQERAERESESGIREGPPPLLASLGRSPRATPLHVCFHAGRSPRRACTSVSTVLATGRAWTRGLSRGSFPFNLLICTFLDCLKGVAKAV